MFRRKRIWTAAAIALTAWLLPTPAFSVERDPYAVKSLIGRVYFEYYRENEDRDDRDEIVSSSFLQQYTLDMRGYYASRRLLVYDAGWGYLNDDYNSDTTEINTGIHSYYLTTTLLPLSYIPLTLGASRETRDTETNSSHNTSTRSEYSLDWSLFFRRLPETTLRAKRIQTDNSNGSDQISDNYQVRMKKDIGPTENELDYTLDNNTVDGNRSTQYSLHLRNITNISKNTIFRLGATRGVTDSYTYPPTTVHGLTLSLDSSPSDAYIQRHSYNYYDSDSEEDKNSGSSYTGEIDFTFTERLNSTLTLNVSTLSNDTPTSTLDSESLSTAVRVGYKLTSAVSLSQLVAYSQTKSNSSDPALNVSDHETLHTLTSVNYGKRLSWAALSVSAGLGYDDEKTDVARGQAIRQNYSITLAGIDLNKYVGANTSLSYNTSSTLSGDNIDSTNLDYNLVMQNKMWRRYAEATAIYTKSIYKTYLTDFETEKDTFNFRASSKYFKNTRLYTNARYSRSYQGLVGTSESTNMGVGGQHNRPLFRGSLGLGLDFSVTDSSYNGISDSATTLRYNLTYNKTLFRQIGWSALFERFEEKRTHSFTYQTTLSNKLSYALRSWLLSMEHNYSLLEDRSNRVARTSLMLKASRSFIRLWR